MPSARAAASSSLVLLAALVFTSSAVANDPGAAALDRRAGAVAPIPAPVARARDALRDRLGAQGVVSVDARTGAPRVVGRLDGYLTGLSERSAPDIALGWVRDNATAMGLDAGDIAALHLTRQWRTGDGYEHVVWEQTIGGIPAIDGGLRANLTTGGRLVNLVGPVVPDLDAATTTPRLDAGAAYEALRRSVAAPKSAPAATTAAGATRPTSFADGANASLVFYRGGASQRLAWQILLPVSSIAIYDAVVDAATGAVVRRANRVDFAAGLAFRNFPGATTGTAGIQTTFDLAPYLPQNATTLNGPNVHAFSDVDDRVPFLNDQVNLTPRPQDEVGSSGGGNWNHAFAPVLDGGGRCTAPGCAWDHAAPNSWAVNRAQDVTQVFFYVNNFHDHFKAAPIGFDAASGNFEGADAILAQSMDGANTGGGLPDESHVDNANMATLPDGQPGLMQMYLFAPQDFGAVSGGDDASVVYHEYTHGLSNRLVVDNQDPPHGALGGAQPGGMGEGWSDFYALDYLETQGLRTDTATPGEVRIGGYLDSNRDTLRSEPIDCAPGDSAPRCPGTPGAGPGGYTYADFGRLKGVPEVHDDGEIWGQTLWSIRQALIAARGRDAGSSRARSYVTTAMRLSPPFPSMLDMRNAILQASPTEDDALLWTVFAQRGMGYFAASDGPDDVRPVPSTDPPPAPGAPTATVTGFVRDETGAAQPGALVAFGGHDSFGRGGLGPDLAAVTSGTGQYTITGVPVGSYAMMEAFAATPGLIPAHRRNVAVAAGANTIDLTLVRDLSSGADVLAPDPVPNDPCPPENAIDDDPGSVWSITTPASPSDPRDLILDLGSPADIGEIRIDPTAGCGDDASSSVGDFELYVAGTDGTFTKVFEGRFDPTDLGHATRIPIPVIANLAARRYVALRILSPLSRDGSGSRFVDVSEIEVRRDTGGGVPTATTLAATSVVSDAAHLQGRVNPGGAGAGYFFEYGPTTAYGIWTEPRDAGGGATDVDAVDIVGGLTPNTTYHYRIVAFRGRSTVLGGDQSFTTPRAKPLSALFAADQITRTGARLRAGVLARNSDTTYHFEYGKNANYGQSTPAGVATGNNPVAAQAILTNLEPDTTYSYRLVATNAAGTTDTAEGRFRTGSVLPVVVTNPATAVTSTTATLNGSINPNTMPTSYRFEFTDGRKTPDKDAGSGDGAKTVTEQVTDLQPSTTYRYKIVAFRGATRFEGPEQTFTTAAAPASAPPPASGSTPPPPVVPGGGGGPAGPLATLGGPATIRTSRGSLTVPITFAASAQKGTAKLDLLLGAKKIAGTTVAVKPGSTVKPRLKLTAAGRKALKRKRKLKVTARLTLPGVQRPMTRTVTLR